MSIWLCSLSPVCLIERSIGHHVPGTLFVNLELHETYRGAIGAADLDVEPLPGFASERVGVIDGPQIPCLDAKLRDVLRDGYEAELFVCDARHFWVVASRG
jgi:hypothetical protein